MLIIIIIEVCIYIGRLPFGKYRVWNELVWDVCEHIIFFFFFLYMPLMLIKSILFIPCLACDSSG